MKFFGRNSQIQVNGKNYTGGGSISVVGNIVYIDGKIADSFDDTKKTEITVLCNVDKITSDESINIAGNVTGDVSAKGNVNCDDIKGSVTAEGNVNCDDIGGDVIASGNVNCDDIGGNAQGRIINYDY